MITVAVCTHDRARLLDGCLDSLARLEIPAGLEWELLVVANACTDDTEEVVRRHSSALPVRLVPEPRLGIGHARNRVLDEARGELIVGTDDDVRPEPAWLREHLLAAAEHPDAAFFGGPVEPEYAVPPPAWVLGNPRIWEGILALRPAAARPREVVPIRSSRDLPCGANLALRRDRLAGIRFDPALGHRGNRPGALEETILLRAILNRGAEGRWVPGASVRHLIRPERLGVAYLEAWYRAFGRISAELRPERVPGRTRLRLRRLQMRAIAGLTAGRKNGRWIRALRRGAKAEGMLQWRAAKRRPPASK